MWLRPNFLVSLDDETRAFLNIAGIKFYTNPTGTLTPYMRCQGYDWICYMHEGNPYTMGYWREVALRVYDYLPSHLR